MASSSMLIGTYLDPPPLVQRQVMAALTPTSPSAVDVQFQEFTVGPLKINAPDRLKSALDITYVDEEMRISRGSKGNLFVLVKAAGMEMGFR